MLKTDKVIISCAITGSIHTPSMTPYLPVTPGQIADQAIAAAEAGAAIVHLHARVPETGAPSQDPALYKQFLERINERSDVVVNITTGGGLGMPMDERLAPAVQAAPELASMNMGSFNFNISGAAERISDFQHDWERPYLEGTKDFILSNTFTQIDYAMRKLNDHGTRFEYECYDTAHLYNLAHFADMGLVKAPFFVQSIFGILGGMRPEVENLMNMKALAERLFGDDYLMSVLAAGRHQLGFATINSLIGGHVRVGLEDSIYISKGELATSNAQQVTKIRAILGELSLTSATPDEARNLLQTKGAEQVGF